MEAARQHQPDVVLLDIAMPVMDGLEALPLIREAAPDATVIMLSGFGADKMVDLAMRQGAAGYIQKGQPMRELVSRVHQLMADAARLGRRLRRAERPLPALPEGLVSRPVRRRAQVWCT